MSNGLKFHSVGCLVMLDLPIFSALITLCKCVQLYNCGRVEYCGMAHDLCGNILCLHCICNVFVLICTDIYSVQLEYGIVGWPRDLCGITQGSRAKDYQGSPYKAATGATHKQRPLK